MNKPNEFQKYATRHLGINRPDSRSLRAEYYSAGNN